MSLLQRITPHARADVATTAAAAAAAAASSGGNPCLPMTQHVLLHSSVRRQRQLLLHQLLPVDCPRFHLQKRIASSRAASSVAAAAALQHRDQQHHSHLQQHQQQTYTGDNDFPFSANAACWRSPKHDFDLPRRGQQLLRRLPYTEQEQHLQQQQLLQQHQQQQPNQLQQCQLKQHYLHDPAFSHWQHPEPPRSGDLRAGHIAVSTVQKQQQQQPQQQQQHPNGQKYRHQHPWQWQEEASLERFLLELPQPPFNVHQQQRQQLQEQPRLQQHQQSTQPDANCSPGNVPSAGSVAHTDAAEAVLEATTAALPHEHLETTAAEVRAGETAQSAPAGAAADAPSALKGLNELRQMGSAQLRQVYMRLLGVSKDPAASLTAETGAAGESAATATPPAAGLSASVLLCLHALELEAMQQGLLLADVPKEELFRHLQAAQLPGEQRQPRKTERKKPLRPLLLNTEWLQQQKEAAYGANPYPIPLRWAQQDLPSNLPQQPQPQQQQQQQHQQQQQPQAQQQQQQEELQEDLLPSRSSVDEPLSVLQRRQVIIEGCIWRRLTAEVQQQLQQLAATGRGGDSGPAKRLWVPWVHDMAKPIASLQQRQRRVAAEAAVAAPVGTDAPPSTGSATAAATAVAVAASDLEGHDACLPQQLDPVLLAVITARTVLQQVLLPRATAPTGPTSRGRECAASSCAGAAAAAAAAAASISGGPELQQRQALVTQVAMAIGDAVHTEVAAAFLEGQQQQYQLGQCYLPLRKQQQKRQQRSSSVAGTATQAAAATPVLLPRWSSRKRLAVGGLLLQLLLKHAMIEAPYAAAKEELSIELQQHRAEQQRILLSRRRKQENEKQKQQQQYLGEKQLLTATQTQAAAVAGALPESAEDIVAAKEAAAAAAAAAAEEEAAIAAEAAADGAAPSGIYVRFGGRAAKELQHLVAYKSRHGHDKVELPAFRHRVVYCAKRRKKFGVIEMRRLCFDRLTAVGTGPEEAAVAAAAAAAATSRSVTATATTPAPPLTATAAAAAASAAVSCPANRTSGLSQSPLPSKVSGGAEAAAAAAAAAAATVRTATDRLSSPFWLMLKHVPMLLPPAPWTSYGSGGYLMLRTAFVRSVSDTDPGSNSSSFASTDAVHDSEEVPGNTDPLALSVGAEADCSKKSNSHVRCNRGKKGGRSNKGNEIYLGWGPRAKACQDFRVYDTSTVRTAVSLLGSVPWQINNEVLKVLQAAWAAGEGLGKMPSRHSMPIAEQLQQHEAQQQQQGGTAGKISSTSSSESRSLLLRHLLQQETRMKSERPSFLLKLETAVNFALSSALYFPHNIDFRGRCYPLPPHLNHMGDDVSRALLRFARSRPLGDSGWRWLRIHMANLFGHNKISFEDRRRWTDTKMQQILAAAEQPLQHKEFWGAAEEPWQALAAVLEIAAAVKSGNPAAFCSKLPVHLDGTCNGLQHYAALNRDLRGGAAVNLVPAETPQDVYSLVLQVVKQNVHRIASGCTDSTGVAVAAAPDVPDGAEAQIHHHQHIKGNVRKQKPLAKELQRQHPQQQERRRELARLCEEHLVLQRSVVKQTVMTVCYGVTALGARDQVLSQLEDLLGGRVRPEVLRELGGFLSRVVLQSIGELFRGAMRTKKWLDAVSTVCTAAGVPVAWKVPAVGLLCEQPYRSLQQQQIRSALQRHTLHVSGDSAPVSRSKQRLGFPPNFIHSLDAAHMMLTALDCIGTRHIDMAAVHDSYWAHAGCIDTLATALRQQFVALYQHNPLQSLYDSVKLRLPQQAAKLPPPPAKGQLDIHQVLDSPYFFH